MPLSRCASDRRTQACLSPHRCRAAGGGCRVSIETCQTKAGKTHYFVWVKSGRQLVATKALVRAERNNTLASTNTRKITGATLSPRTRTRRSVHEVSRTRRATSSGAPPEHYNVVRFQPLVGSDVVGRDFPVCDHFHTRTNGRLSSNRPTTCAACSSHHGINDRGTTRAEGAKMLPNLATKSR